MKHTLNLPRLNIIAHRFRTPAINLAACAESRAQNLLHGTFKILGHGLEPHLARDLDDLVERDGFGVLDVLLLLAVSRRLLEGLDNERRCGRDNGDGGLTVLDGEADGDTEAFLLQISIRDSCIL